jgi:nucleoside-diphosphate-sugar epimerase
VTMSGEVHVVFGAGQVGSRLAAQLLHDGKRVRIAKRTPAAVPPAAEVTLGDAADRAFCIAAADEAASVYNCMNPPYGAQAWASLLPLYGDNLIAAAGKTGARLIVLNNLYMLGRTGGRLMDEDTPINPCSKKGEVRARVSERLFAAHRRGDVRAAEGRASDFYGPGANQSYIGDYFWKPALAGKTVQLPIDPDAVHTYHYVPDVAAGLALLGQADDATLGRAWMLPCQPAGTLCELAGRLSDALGSTIRLARIPRWVIKAGAIFVPLLRELDEMRYQWDEPFIVDDRRFRERFSAQPVDPRDAARATVDWAKQRYGRDQ